MQMGCLGDPKNLHMRIMYLLKKKEGIEDLKRRLMDVAGSIISCALS